MLEFKTAVNYFSKSVNIAGLRDGKKGRVKPVQNIQISRFKTANCVLTYAHGKMSDDIKLG